MPTAFETRFASRAATRLLARFGEWITYRPRDDRPRSIRAMVKRFPPMKVPETGEVLAAHIDIEVLDDSINGISSATLDTGGDQVEIAPALGKALQAYSIRKKLPSEDSALLSLECG